MAGGSAARSQKRERNKGGNKSIKQQVEWRGMTGPGEEKQTSESEVLSCEVNKECCGVWHQAWLAPAGWMLHIWDGAPVFWGLSKQLSWSLLITEPILLLFIACLCFPPLPLLHRPPTLVQTPHLLMQFSLNYILLSKIPISQPRSFTLHLFIQDLNYTPDCISPFLPPTLCPLLSHHPPTVLLSLPPTEQQVCLTALKFITCIQRAKGDWARGEEELRSTLSLSWQSNTAKWQLTTHATVQKTLPHHLQLQLSWGLHQTRLGWISFSISPLRSFLFPL